MTLDELLTVIEDKSPPAPLDALSRFEAQIGQRLPDDYREFLILCNGGYARGEIQGPSSRPCINHIGGFRAENYFSLEDNRDNYQSDEDLRIPKDLIWIADDPMGNAICLGISGDYRNRIYFWDHNIEPDPETWDHRVETSGNITLLANSFTDFIVGLKHVID